MIGRRAGFVTGGLLVTPYPPSPLVQRFPPILRDTYAVILAVTRGMA